MSSSKWLTVKEVQDVLSAVTPLELRRLPSVNQGAKLHLRDVCFKHSERLGTNLLDAMAESLSLKGATATAFA